MEPEDCEFDAGVLVEVVVVVDELVPDGADALIMDSAAVTASSIPDVIPEVVWVETSDPCAWRKKAVITLPIIMDARLALPAVPRVKR